MSQQIDANRVRIGCESEPPANQIEAFFRNTSCHLTPCFATVLGFFAPLLLFGCELTAGSPRWTICGLCGLRWAGLDCFPLRNQPHAVVAGRLVRVATRISPRG